jgi:hypothetical protein
VQLRLHFSIAVPACAVIPAALPRAGIVAIGTFYAALQRAWLRRQAQRRKASVRFEVAAIDQHVQFPH